MLTFLGFAAIAAVGGVLGVSNREFLLAWVNTLSEHRTEFALGVILLLTIDSLLAIPTMATAILAGHVLGTLLGGTVTTIGIGCAGTAVYTLSRFGGQRLLPKDLAKPLAFVAHKYGIWAFVFCRTIPMMPEALSAIAGVSKLRFLRYLPIFLATNAPFAFIGAWAGSISTVDSPAPGLIAGFAPPTLGVILLVALKIRHQRTSKTIPAD